MSMPVDKYIAQNGKDFYPGCSFEGRKTWFDSSFGMLKDRRSNLFCSLEEALEVILKKLNEPNREKLENEIMIGGEMKNFKIGDSVEMTKFGLKTFPKITKYTYGVVIEVDVGPNKNIIVDREDWYLTPLKKHETKEEKMWHVNFWKKLGLVKHKNPIFDKKEKINELV